MTSQDIAFHWRIKDKLWKIHDTWEFHEFPFFIYFSLEKVLIMVYFTKKNTFSFSLG